MSNQSRARTSAPAVQTFNAARLARQAQRDIEYLDSQAITELAHIDFTVEVHQAKVDAVNTVGNAALVATAQLSQTEVTLAQMVPHASGRLAAISDLVAIQTAEVVVDSAKRIRG